jgi:hypothetical protein
MLRRHWLTILIASAVAYFGAAAALAPYGDVAETQMVAARQP